MLSSSYLAAAEYKTPYDKYIINTVGDYLRVCEPLINPDHSSPDASYKAISCLSFISGIMKGYTSTLSLNAEYKLAYEEGIKRSVLVTQIDNDSELHEKLEKIYFSSHFLCFGNKVGFYDIAKNVGISLENKGIDKNKSIHHIVLNEMQALFPCPEK